MSNRKKTSGGQAIVMVSLALISMSGMMGLAVDLGWSFFTQKAAQAAADDAALSAVQSAYVIIVQQFKYPSWFSFCSDTGQVTCKPTPVTCDPANAGLNNLQSGCLYAKNDGFVPGGHGGRQNVLIQANMPSVALPDSIPTPPGSPKDMVYWVTVRTYESIPQLFSFVNGKQNGAIAAVATAAIASKVLGGSFYGMNNPGDCFTANGTSYCGVDFVGGGSSAACASGPSAFLCAPGGAFIASKCNGAADLGCSGNSNYAGTGSMSGGPAINIPVANALDPSGTWTPAPTVTPAGGYRDPTQGEEQPPLAASTATKSCGVRSIPPNATLGPFQYYHYTFSKFGSPDPDGAQITLPSDTTFAANGTCPGVVSSTGTDQASSAFPLYVFYGGLSTGANTITFGPGQYVMAGVKGTNGVVFNADQANLVTAGANGDNYTGSGNLFIVTDQNYPGMQDGSSPQLGSVPNNTDLIPILQFGSTSLKGGSGTTDLFGMGANSTTGTSNLPTNLNGYGGTLFWQDRGNSTVTYDANGKVLSQTNSRCLGDSSCTSPELLLNNLQNLHGLVYQPRGAWTKVSGAVSTSSLQLLTGAIVGTGGGSLQLTSPTRPAIRYLPVLIQ